mmetsp:Transcript_21070/g.64185  ORF Transcript_21070/g.64185 Transcript_21070/m.64185 type:complete len:182 (+) Transcript_21070:620-1165(+)
MIEHVIAEARKPLPSGAAPEFFLDAYCGGGLFALQAAKDFKIVIGVDISPGSIQSAQLNAELNGLDNAYFTEADSTEIFKQVRGADEHIENDFHPSRSIVVIDPPRKGCDEAFLDQLIAYGPARVVYVSCDASTQARDAKYLLAKAPYAISRVMPVDLFPQTRHIESVITFDRVEAEGFGL